MFLKLIEEMLTLIGGLIVCYFVYVFFTRKNDKPDTDTPRMAHTALRELVERAVDEARKLPGLGDSVTARTQETPSIHEQSYEDLLASAILNKVIEKYQRDQVDDNSNVLPEKSRNRRYIRDEYINDVDEVDGSSGLEPSSCDDEDNNEFNGTRSKFQTHQEPLSLTIEEEIEEVTTTFTSNQDPDIINSNILNFRNARRVPFPEYGMDIVDPLQDSSDDSQNETDQSAPMDHITNVESWEENWLFQKKRIPTQSEPVSMLVPNPSADYRALIGDKDAEDTSDLSEFSAQSDEEEEEEEEEIDEELIETINQLAPKSSKVEQVELQTHRINDSQIFNDNFNNEILIEDQTRKTCNNNQHEDRNNSDISVTRLVGNVPHQQINGISTLSEQINKIDKSDEVKPCNLENVVSFLDNCEEEKKKEDDEESQVPIEVSSTSTSNLLQQEEICEPEKSNRKLIPGDENSDKKFETLNCQEDKKIDQFSSTENQKNEEQITKNSTLEIEDSTENIELCREAKTLSVSQAREKKLSNEDLERSAPPRPGTIAEREHKKWENAAPIQNNPYSQENIEKRLLERQYSRRSPEISGNPSVLPSSPSSPLQIVLGASRPDVKRFGRDYYINESKLPAGERLARASTSNSSRPTSSLSQNSTSTSSDFEHQVSQGLEKIEEAALRGCLHRSTYRGVNASPQFVTNPLIHMDLRDTNFENNIQDISEILTDKLVDKSCWTPSYYNDNLNMKILSPSGLNDCEINSICTINPLFCHDNNNLLPNPNESIPDRDSGMYSIGSNDIDYSKVETIIREKSNDDQLSSRLSWNESTNGLEDKSIFLINGKKYWVLNTHKFHTFGGIKRKNLKNFIDDTLESDETLNYDIFEKKVEVDFSKLKFQTFGGIKSRNKIDEDGLFIFRGPKKVRRSMINFVDSLSTTKVPVRNQPKILLKSALSDEEGSLRLEPPLLPNVVDRKFTSLIDLRKLSKNTELLRRRRRNPKNHYRDEN